VRQEFKKVEGDPNMVKMLRDSLGLDPDYKEPTDDTRQLNIQTITVEFKEHKVEQVVSLRTLAEQRNAVHQHDGNAKVYVKEGCEFKVRVNFRAQHYIIAGLKVRSTIKRMRKTIAEDEEKLGSYNPTTQFKDLCLPTNGYNVAPSGYLLRGTYLATLVFSSDEVTNLLTVNYQVIVQKNFAS
jgi:Rho GDP-dissociation inhibitor